MVLLDLCAGDAFDGSGAGSTLTGPDVAGLGPMAVLSPTAPVYLKLKEGSGQVYL